MAYVMDYYSEIFENLLNGKVKTKEEIHSLKIKLCRKYCLDRVPSDVDVLERAPEDIYSIVEPILRLKPMRTISGVAPIAVMTSPEKCPHGTCSYCPGGVDQGSAQSYTGHEPAAMRAGDHDFDPYLQTRSRLEQLSSIGHPTDKIDLIIMGGTFTARPEEYQNKFIKGCFAALNDHPKWDQKLQLNELQQQNETADHRCIGMTIETRPDWCKEPQIDNVLALGGTRVELGVQTAFDDVLNTVSRGHCVQDSIDATRISKDSGLKVCYHLMPGLPGSSKERDTEMFERIFSDPSFKPDMLKIYPTLVVKGTPLYEQWKDNKYEPLSIDDTIEIVAELKTKLPPWARIQRIQRDIPVQYIESGITKSNLRQLILQHIDDKGLKCNCIRCREAGHQGLLGIEPDIDKIELRTISYDSSEGSEVFMSFEDLANNILIAFIRLRLPSDQAHRPEFKRSVNYGAIKPNDCAMIRELKVFGPMVPFNDDEQGKDWQKSDINLNTSRPWQHQGYGQLLLAASEQYAKEQWDTKKLMVMSGVGVKQYYSRFGFIKDGVYMSKSLKL
jgi:elongator complex protein 3